MPSKAVWVCTWDPNHTVDRIEAQVVAKRDGTLAALVKKYKGAKLERAMEKAKLASYRRTLKGDRICLTCGALMESVLASPGISDRLEAVRDVAQDYGKAAERTRRART